MSSLEATVTGAKHDQVETTKQKDNTFQETSIESKPVPGLCQSGKQSIKQERNVDIVKEVSDQVIAAGHKTDGLSNCEAKGLVMDKCRHDKQASVEVVAVTAASENEDLPRERKQLSAEPTPASLKIGVRFEDTTGKQTAKATKTGVGNKIQAVDSTNDAVEEKKSDAHTRNGASDNEIIAHLVDSKETRSTHGEKAGTAAKEKVGPWETDAPAAAANEELAAGSRNGHKAVHTREDKQAIKLAESETRKQVEHDTNAAEKDDSNRIGAAAVTQTSATKRQATVQYSQHSARAAAEAKDGKEAKKKNPKKRAATEDGQPRRSTRTKDTK